MLFIRCLVSEAATTTIAEATDADTCSTDEWIDVASIVSATAILAPVAIAVAAQVSVANRVAWIRADSRNAVSRVGDHVDAVHGIVDVLRCLCVTAAMLSAVAAAVSFGFVCVKQ